MKSLRFFLIAVALVLLVTALASCDALNGLLSGNAPTTTTNEVPSVTTEPTTTAAPVTTEPSVTTEAPTTTVPPVTTLPPVTTTAAPVTTLPPVTTTASPIVQKVPADIDVFVFNGMLAGYTVGYGEGCSAVAERLASALSLPCSTYDAALISTIHVAVEPDGLIALSNGDYHIYMEGETIHILGGDAAGLSAAVDAFIATVENGETSHSQYLHTVHLATKPPMVETFASYADSTELIGGTTASPLHYHAGDEITFVLNLKIGGAAAGCTSFRYKVQADDTKEVLSGTVSGENGIFIITVPAGFTLIPGSVRLSVDAYDAAGKLLPSIYSGTAALPNTTTGVVRPNYSYIGGAIVDADEITSDVLAPADFATFWAERLSELPNPAKRINSISAELYRNGLAIFKMDADYLTKIGYSSMISSLDSYDMFEIYLRCDTDTSYGRPAVGYVTVPKNAKPGSLPIIVALNAYGARDGYFGTGGNSIRVAMHPCGLPKGYFDEDGDFTATNFSQDNGFARYVADYDDPASAYLCKMLLRNVQMLRFLTDPAYNLDEYDLRDTDGGNMTDYTAYNTMRAAYNGKIQFSYGGSMGGFQNVATAALCMMEVEGERLVKGEITSIVVGCPWMCDPIAVAGASGRLMGLGTRIGTMPGDSLEELNLVGLSYFDTVHFGALLTEGKIEIQAGFGDTTCPSSGMVALYNAVKIQKDLYFTQNKDHSGKNPNADGNGKGALTTHVSAPAELPEVTE